MDGTLILLVVLLIIAIILLIVALRAGRSDRAARQGVSAGAEQASMPGGGDTGRVAQSSAGGRENTTPALAAPPAGASGVSPSASTAVGPAGEPDQRGQQGEHGERGQQQDNAPAATPVAPEGAVPDPERVQMPPAQLAASPSSMGASGLGAPPAMTGQPIASQGAIASDDTRPTSAPEAATAQAVQESVDGVTPHEDAQTAGQEQQPDAEASMSPATSPEAARQDGRATGDADGRGDVAMGELVPRPATRSGEIRLAATPGRLPYRLAELVGEQRQLEESISLAHRRLDEIELGHEAGSPENRVRLAILRQDLAQKQERLREILYLQDGYYWLQQQMAPALDKVVSD